MHHGLLASLSVSNVDQLLVDEPSTVTASAFQVFSGVAHLLGVARIPQLGIAVGRVHWYQISVRVGVQNCVSAALLVIKH